MAYDPPPPPPVGGNGDQELPGGGAPIDGGVLLLTPFALVYAIWKKKKLSRDQETIILED